MAGTPTDLMDARPMRSTSSIWVTGWSLCLSAAILAAAAVRFPPVQQAPSDAPEGTAYVPGGIYEPLYAERDGSGSVEVAPFFLGRHPVTNAEFLEFVAENAAWRRSQVRNIYAEPGYLRHWADDLDFGPDSLANRPVVNVSWFAACAYAEWRGMRLPTTAEWELAASGRAPGEKVGRRAGKGAGRKVAQQRARPAGDQEDRQAAMAAWYSRPASGVLPEVGSSGCDELGVCDLNGLVWEWVEDFNSALVTGESRNNNDVDLTLFCGSAAVNAKDFDDYAAFLRFGFRRGLEAPYVVSSLGFRLAKDAAEPTG